MAVSYIKKLQNEIALYEENSDRIIPPENYYVVVITIQNNAATLFGKKVDMFTKYAEEIASVTETTRPSVIYVYPPHIYYLYSSVDEKSEHRHNGSQQEICSEFSSVASIILSTPVTTRIVELETKSQVQAYFCLKNFENTRNSLVLLSKEKLSRKDVSQYTLQECIELFDKKTGSVWEKIPHKERFGVFIKGAGSNKRLISIALDFKDIEGISAILF